MFKLEFCVHIHRYNAQDRKYKGCNSIMKGLRLEININVSMKCFDFHVWSDIWVAFRFITLLDECVSLHKTQIWNIFTFKCSGVLRKFDLEGAYEDKHLGTFTETIRNPIYCMRWQNNIPTAIRTFILLVLLQTTNLNQITTLSFMQFFRSFPSCRQLQHAKFKQSGTRNRSEVSWTLSDLNEANRVIV